MESHIGKYFKENSFSMYQTTDKCTQPIPETEEFWYSSQTLSDVKTSLLALSHNHYTMTYPQNSMKHENNYTGETNQLLVYTMYLVTTWLQTGIFNLIPDYINI